MMNTDSSVATPIGVDREGDSARRWPQFSRQEVRRLEFVVYRRGSGRMRPAPPVRAEVDALCTALLARSARPAARPSSHRGRRRAPVQVPPWRSVRGGIPLTWAVYAELYGTRRPGYVDRHRRRRQ